jgi:hypothetical protein
MPVKLLGALTNWPDSGAGLGLVTVVGGGGGGTDVVDRGGDDVDDGVDDVVDDVVDDGGAVGLVVETAAASSAGHPYRDASTVARSPPA